MASKQRDVQDTGIVFGDWKLVPVDSLNWELCHRHETTDNVRARAAGSVGTVRWHRLGRYYSYSTFGNALLYAADCELKRGCAEAVMELGEALDRYERIADGLREAVVRP